MKKNILSATVLLMLTATLHGCGTEPNTNAPHEITATDPTNIPAITDTTVTTDTTEPTETPVPTLTVAPTETSTPEPTATTEPTATIAPTATVAPTATPKPTATIAPTATVAPTATPKPTATPWPTPTDIPIPTPGPTPSVSQIKGVTQKPISFHVYECGEKGEEVLALVKSLREENPNLYPNDLINLLSDEYDYSEQDILYGVYNSGWNEWCTEIAQAQIDDGEFSEHRLLEYMGTYFPYIEEDTVYAVENCAADWNEEAVESLELLLYGKYRSGTSYIYAVEFMKQGYYTDEQIEYALNAVGEIDWEEQVYIKIKVYTEDSKTGISYPSLLDRLVGSHDFDYELAKKAVESIKDKVDWNAQAVLAAKYFAPYRSSREDLLHALTFNKFTDEQAEYAAKAIGW